VAVPVIVWHVLHLKAHATVHQHRLPARQALFIELASAKGKVIFQHACGAEIDTQNA